MLRDQWAQQEDVLFADCRARGGQPCEQARPLRVLRDQHLIGPAFQQETGLDAAFRINYSGELSKKKIKTAARRPAPPLGFYPIHQRRPYTKAASIDPAQTQPPASPNPQHPIFNQKFIQPRHQGPEPRRPGQKFFWGGAMSPAAERHPLAFFSKNSVAVNSAFSWRSSPIGRANPTYSPYS